MILFQASLTSAPSYFLYSGSKRLFRSQVYISGLWNLPLYILSISSSSVFSQSDHCTKLLDETAFQSLSV